MFIITKKLILVLFITSISIASIHSEDKKQNTQEVSWDTVLTTAKSTYENLSEKCKALYNPLSIVALSVTSAALGLKNIGLLLVGGAVVAHADQISEFVKESFEKPAQPTEKKE